MENIKEEKEREIFHTLLKTKENTSFVINETPRANSYEFGKAGNRFKIYFSDVEDLQRQLKGIVDAGLAVEGDFKSGIN